MLVAGANDIALLRPPVIPPAKSMIPMVPW